MSAPKIPANLPKKKGRPRDPKLELMRQLFPNWSDRTVRTFCWADRQLVKAALVDIITDEEADEIRERAQRLATRKNDTFSVKRYADVIEGQINIAFIRFIGKFAENEK